MPIFEPYKGPPLLERIVSVENMTLAWRRVRRNIQLARHGRSAGLDQVSIRDFAADWPNQMAQLADEIRCGTYQPLPPKMVRLPKRSGGERAIGLLAIRDRVAQRAAHQVLEPVFDPHLLDCAYGCRPGLGVPDALARVARYAELGYTWVVDADIAAYYDSIDQRILLGLFRQRVGEVAVLQLVARWLEAGSHRTADTAPLVPGRAEGSLLHRGREALRRLAEGAGAPPGVPALPDYELDYAAGAWEQPGVDGWAGSGTGWRPAPGAPSPANALWSAFLLARPALSGARWALPYLQRIGAQRLAVAGGVAAGALAAYELAVRWQTGHAVGTIQGGALSPLLANIYLHPFDLALTSQGLRLVRFVDDFVIMCASRAEAEQALRLVERQLATLRLRLSPEKTRLVDYGEGLAFLGQTLAPRQRGTPFEHGLESFEEADRRIREALRQAREWAPRAGGRLRRRRAKGSGGKG